MHAFRNDARRVGRRGGAGQRMRYRGGVAKRGIVRSDDGEAGRSIWRSCPGRGRIDVRVGDGDAVRIVGRIHAYGSFFGLVGYTPEEQAKSLASSPPIEQSGRAVSVGDIRDPVLGSNVSISYEVTVPPDTRLRTSSRSGDQTIELVRGPVVASSRSGSIEIGRVAGDVEIETRSGHVDVRLPSGRRQLSTSRRARAPSTATCRSGWTAAAPAGTSARPSDAAAVASRFTPDRDRSGFDSARCPQT